MSFQQKLHRLKHFSLKEVPGLLVQQINQQAVKTIERLSYSPHSKSKNKLAPKKVGPINLFHQDVKTAGYSELFKTNFEAEMKNLILRADKALDLKIDILGSGEIDLKEFRDRKDLQSVEKKSSSKLIPTKARGRIPWHYDLKSGIGWDPETFYSDIKFGSKVGADIKVPWELSRCSQFVWLGQAYRLTLDEKYLHGFVNQVTDWIEQNPVKFGVNWACPMDVAIRACNWILAWEMFSDVSAVPVEFEKELAQSLWEHGNHLVKHLEWRGQSSTNHYISNLVGLYYLGLALKNSGWVQLARKKLSKEILNQSYSDGFAHEGSTAYHLLDLELFLSFAIIENRQSGGLKKEMGQAFEQRLQKMIERSIQIVKTTGEFPQIGDNDGGKLHIVSEMESLNAKALINLGCLLFKKSDFKIENWTDDPNLVWFFGFSGRETFRAMPGKDIESLSPTKLSDSGLIIFRDKDLYATFSAQPNGTKGVGNHTHNDKLSFTLSLKNQDFIVDPGTGVYTSNSKIRNQLRSTLSHNTVEVDSEEQNRFISGSLFSLRNDSIVKIISSDPGKGIKASHGGYKREGDDVIHVRDFSYDTPIQELNVRDRIEGSGMHSLVWSFVTSPQITINNQKESFELVGQSHKIILELMNSELDVKIEEGPYSPKYGIVEKTKIIRLRTRAKLPFEAQFKFKWSAK